VFSFATSGTGSIGAFVLLWLLIPASPFFVVQWVALLLQTLLYKGNDEKTSGSLWSCLSSGGVRSKYSALPKGRCETGCFLPFAGVLSVLKMPHFVRFLSSFYASYRRHCYMGCYIFCMRSVLPNALFRWIHHSVVRAPQPISVGRSLRCVQLDQYESLATLRLQSSRTSLCVRSQASLLLLVHARGVSLVRLLEYFALVCPFLRRYDVPQLSRLNSAMKNDTQRSYENKYTIEFRHFSWMCDRIVYAH
jgi:hypothetical protein